MAPGASIERTDLNELLYDSLILHVLDTRDSTGDSTRRFMI